MRISQIRRFLEQKMLVYLAKKKTSSTPLLMTMAMCMPSDVSLSKANMPESNLHLYLRSLGLNCLGSQIVRILVTRALLPGIIAVCLEVPIGPALE